MPVQDDNIEAFLKSAADVRTVETARREGAIDALSFLRGLALLRDETKWRRLIVSAVGYVCAGCFAAGLFFAMLSVMPPVFTKAGMAAAGLLYLGCAVVCLFDLPYKNIAAVVGFLCLGVFVFVSDTIFGFGRPVAESLFVWTLLAVLWTTGTRVAFLWAGVSFLVNSAACAFAFETGFPVGMFSKTAFLTVCLVFNATGWAACRFYKKTPSALKAAFAFQTVIFLSTPLVYAVLNVERNVFFFTGLFFLSVALTMTGRFIGVSVKEKAVSGTSLSVEKLLKCLDFSFSGENDPILERQKNAFFRFRPAAPLKAFLDLAGSWTGALSLYRIVLLSFDMSPLRLLIVGACCAGAFYAMRRFAREETQKKILWTPFLTGAMLFCEGVSAFCPAAAPAVCLLLFFFVMTDGDFFRSVSAMLLFYWFLLKFSYAVSPASAPLLTTTVAASAGAALLLFPPKKIYARHIGMFSAFVALAVTAFASAANTAAGATVWDLNGEGVFYAVLAALTAKRLSSEMDAFEKSLATRWLTGTFVASFFLPAGMIGSAYVFICSWLIDSLVFGVVSVCFFAFFAVTGLLCADVSFETAAGVFFASGALLFSLKRRLNERRPS